MFFACDRFFTKYCLVKPLTDEKAETVLNDFIRIIIESNPKPSKLWVSKGREFPVRTTITLRKNG